MSRSQLEKLSISQIPTSGTSFTYYNTFSVVQEGSDEASRQVLMIEPASSPIIEDGQTLITSKNFDLTVSGLFKASTISGLQTLADARTSVVFGGIGLGGQILQAEGSINVNQVFSETASFRFNSPREATGGYDSATGKHTSRLAYSTNGLCLYKWGAAAATGTNALAYGWTKSSGATVSFASSNDGVQTFSHSGAATLHRDLYLPSDGSNTFYFNIAVTAITDGGSGNTIKIKLQSFSDFGSTEDVTATETVITTTGNKQVNITPSSDSKMIRASIVIAASDSISFKQPTVELDSTYDFTEFNT